MGKLKGKKLPPRKKPRRAKPATPRAVRFAPDEIAFLQRCVTVLQGFTAKPVGLTTFIRRAALAHAAKIIGDDGIALRAPEWARLAQQITIEFPLPEEAAPPASKEAGDAAGVAPPALAAGGCRRG